MKNKTNTNPKVISYDLDGTIADLYGVENWLEYLTNEDATPYAIAKPLVNMSLLARYLNKAQRNGYKLVVVSWLAKYSTPEYDEKVIEAKKKWLVTHLKSVKWDEINIVSYGTPKHEISNGILFDDEEPNRTAWEKADGIAYEPKKMFEVLKKIA